LVYCVDGGVAATPGTTFDAMQCDAIRKGRTLINDHFARVVASNVVSSIAVPMIRNGVMLGSFGAFSREECVYDGRDAKALVAIAQLAALVLENAHFVNEIQRARVEAERLEEIGRAISGSLDLPEVLARVVDAAIELVEADSATVWLLRGENEVEAAMTAGEIAPQRGIVLPIPAALRRRMVDLRKPYILYEDVKSGEHDLPVSFRTLTKAASTMAVALIVEDTVVGALSVGHKHPTRYGPEEIRRLERISFQAAIAVGNARLHEQIHRLSLTDPLTEMPNRRHLYVFLETEIAAAKRGRDLCLLIFDLDHFKQYNDQHGHQAGDTVLHVFGRLLQRHMRAMNLTARYGGDEFVTVLADVTLEGAVTLAKRILLAMEEEPLLANAGIHATVGIAKYDPEMASYEDLIRAADRDLYSRKKARTEITT
jgi:diguanylate cyclase (GGDEF)-like protein